MSVKKAVTTISNARIHHSRSTQTLQQPTTQTGTKNSPHCPSEKKASRTTRQQTHLRSTSHAPYICKTFAAMPPRQHCKTQAFTSAISHPQHQHGVQKTSTITTDFAQLARCQHNLDPATNTTLHLCPTMSGRTRAAHEQQSHCHTTGTITTAHPFLAYSGEGNTVPKDSHVATQLTRSLQSWHRHHHIAAFQLTRLNLTKLFVTAQIRKHLLQKATSEHPDGQKRTEAVAKRHHTL